MIKYELRIIFLDLQDTGIYIPLMPHYILFFVRRYSQFTTALQCELVHGYLHKINVPVRSCAQLIDSLLYETICHPLPLSDRCDEPIKG